MENAIENSQIEEFIETKGRKAYEEKKQLN